DPVLPRADRGPPADRRHPLACLRAAARPRGEPVLSPLLRRLSVSKPVIVGHRGAAGLAPENTVPGFRHAYERGVRWIELDVRLTRDGELAVIHDPTLERTTSGSGSVAGLSMSELQALDAGKRFGIACGMPTLEEAVASVPEDVFWFIE